MASQEDQQEEQAQMLERLRVQVAVNRMADNKRRDQRRLTQQLSRRQPES